MPFWLCHFWLYPFGFTSAFQSVILQILPPQYVLLYLDVFRNVSGTLFNTIVARKPLSVLSEVGSVFAALGLHDTSLPRAAWACLDVARAVELAALVSTLRGGSEGEVHGFLYHGFSTDDVHTYIRRMSVNFSLSTPTVI